MREFLKRAKADYLLSSVLCIALGIIFVVWKGGVIDVIGTILSIAMIIVGIGRRTCISWNSSGDRGCESKKIRI